MEMLKAIWRYRHFILSSIRSDIRVRFARSRLGATWVILQPLAQVAIYALVLSRILAAKLPGVHSMYAYPIYLMAGMLSWNLFNELMTRSMTMFLENANIMKKIMFPRVCLPLIVSGSCLVNNLFLFIATIGIFALLGHWPSVNYLWLPVLVVVTMLFGSSVGMILGVLNVFVRDVSQVMNVILQLWFWLTPVVYMASIIPPRYSALFKANPMYSLVTAYQTVILYNRTPNFFGIAILSGVSILIMVLALFMFRRAAPEMVDVL